MDLSVERRPVCLLTGAGGTLGTAFATRYGDRFSIAGVYRHREPTVDTQRSRTVDPLHPMRVDREPMFAIHADLTCPGEIDRVVDLALARFDHVDLLVNAAGLALWAPVLTSPTLVERCAAQFEINTLVPLRIIAALVDRCWRDRVDENRRRNRSVVNVSSAAGVWVYAGRGQSVYAASKSALNTLSVHLADELATIGVRVNALAPDSFPDPVPTEAVAAGIARLADETVTGEILVVDTSGCHPI